MNNTADLVTVSIGMPVYNGEEHMRVALDSLLAQTFTDFELILSDNASTDGTQAIAREYAARDPRIRYHRQATNIGALNNFNFVLNETKGRYYMWAAHDDIWEPDFLQEMVARLNGDDGVEIAFCRLDNISFDGQMSEREFDLRVLEAATVPAVLEKFLMHREDMGKANLFYGLLRRRTIVSLGGLKIWGDGDWGADMLHIFSILLRGRPSVSERLLFHKRSGRNQAGPAESAVKISGLEKRRRRYCEKKQLADDWLGYWKGYERQLERDTGLPRIDNQRLMSLVRSQCSLYRRRRMKYGLSEWGCARLLALSSRAGSREASKRA